jgi:hypothetical protein
MNGKHLAGQFFLWTGFIAAALAATCQLEIDLLPETEKTLLEQLPNKLKVVKTDLDSALDKPISELDEQELKSAIENATRFHEAALSADAAKIEETPENPEADEAGKNENAKTVSKSDFVKARTSRLANKWSTVKWLWYGLSMAAGLVGVVLLRSTAKTAEQDQGRVNENYSTVQSSLVALNQKIGKLDRELSSMSPEQSVQYIDEGLADHFSDFADARKSMIQRFGLPSYAEIMTQFASAERFVNRAWSASADGYMGEVKDCVTRAKKHLAEAQQLLNKCEEKPV